MTALSEWLLRKNYSDYDHPYRIFERRVENVLGPGDVLLDAGCGRTAPVLRKFTGRTNRLIGVELVEFTEVPADVEAVNADLAHLPLPDECVDIIISRSVFEHLTDPEAVYREFSRVLRHGGLVIFLTANMWDYGTLTARAVPNRFHARIVSRIEGRAENDTFPTVYRTNTRRCIERLASSANLRVESFDIWVNIPTT